MIAALLLQCLQKHGVRDVAGQEGEKALQTPSHCMSCFLFSIIDPFILHMCSKDRSSDHYSCQRHSYGDLRELRQARFLLQVCPGEGARGRTIFSWKRHLGAMETPSESAGHLRDPLHTCA